MRQLSNGHEKKNSSFGVVEFSIHQVQVSCLSTAEDLLVSKISRPSFFFFDRDRTDWWVDFFVVTFGAESIVAVVMLLGAFLAPGSASV
jgi:hypothetical protein